MKNIFYSVVALSLMLFASCDNENSVNPNTEELGSATISGKFRIELDTPGLDPVPDGIVVVLAVDKEDLVANPVDDVDYGVQLYTTTTTDGGFSITIDDLPANRIIDVTITSEAFRYNFRSDEDSDPDGTLETTTELLWGQEEIDEIEIYAGGTFLVDYDFVP